MFHKRLLIFSKTHCQLDWAEHNQFKLSYKISLRRFCFNKEQQNKQQYSVYYSNTKQFCHFKSTKDTLLIACLLSVTIRLVFTSRNKRRVSIRTLIKRNWAFHLQERCKHGLMRRTLNTLPLVSACCSLSSCYLMQHVLANSLPKITQGFPLISVLIA